MNENEKQEDGYTCREEYCGGTFCTFTLGKSQIFASMDIPQTSDDKILSKISNTDKDSPHS